MVSAFCSVRWAQSFQNLGSFSCSVHHDKTNLARTKCTRRLKHTHLNLFPQGCRGVITPRNGRSCYFLVARDFIRVVTKKNPTKAGTVFPKQSFVLLKKKQNICCKSGSFKSSILYVLTRELWLLQTGRNEAGPSDERYCHLHGVASTTL